MKKNLLATAGVLTAGLVIGSAFAISGANAADDVAATPVATSTESSTTTSTTDAGDANEANERLDAFSTTSIKPGESLVTGDAAAKLIDLALAQFPGATVIRVENDSDGDEFEVHLKKADGSVVTVTFDEDYSVTGDHEGFADPADIDDDGPRGDHDGDHDGDDEDGDGPAAGGFTAPTVGTTTN